MKGIHYRNPLVYDALTWLKLWKDYDLRFQIARQYLKEDDRVLDLCAGTGRLKRFLPKGCSYTCVDMSPRFLVHLSRQKIPVIRANLHEGLPIPCPQINVATMLISLCQFRETSLHTLLEDYKKAAERIVIVEDVLTQPRALNSPLQRITNYLCAIEHFVPMQLFTQKEFETIMQEHQYQCIKHSERYYVGYYANH